MPLAKDSPMSPLCRLHQAALTLAAIALCAGLLGGCARPAALAPKPAGDSLSAVSPAPLALMTPAQKASQIATSFPPQVPVPSGTVSRGEAQGDTAWDYELLVPGEVSAVMRWYLDAYTNAEWTVISRSASEMTLKKNNAQSRIVLTSGGTAPAQTKVIAVVGVGTPVLSTQ
jgi:hypothetical protein